MKASLTPAARRTLEACRRMANGELAPQVWCDLLMFALLEIDSLAAAALERLGVSAESLLSKRHTQQNLTEAAQSLQETFDSIEGEYSPYSTPTAELNDPLAFVQILERATSLARRDADAEGVSSAHLLVAVFETNQVLRNQLLDQGIDRERIVAELNLETPLTEPAVPVDFELQLAADEHETSAIGFPTSNIPESPRTSNIAGAWRILDANLNRCREGLRVLEDFARFVQNDSHLSRELKGLRHELVAAERLLASRTKSSTAKSDDGPNSELLQHRNTDQDVGTSITTFRETQRQDIADVVIANSRRVQESLRSLEEFGKLVAPEFAATMKQIRYRAYSLQQLFQESDHSVSAISNRDKRIARLNEASLYVLITESTCFLPWKQVAEATLQGGADILQLREKHLNDRELLRRARWLVDACRRAGALMIVNDRADVAVAVDADGVHTGQEEFTTSDARKVLLPDQILGISTHSQDQALLAVTDGADYVGVGPTFPSSTKAFSEFPGLSLVEEVCGKVPLPAFAIGGICAENLEKVTRAGASRVAVSSAIAGSEDPELSTQQLLRILRVRH